MTPETTSRAVRIIGLFPELLGVGGVQEAGRLTVAALDEIASRSERSVDILGLNDPSGAHVLEVGERRVVFRGFGRAKLRFLLSAIRSARRSGNACTSIVFAAHPNLALCASLMKWFTPSLKTIVMSHGIEVWSPLSILRRNALRGADLATAPSGDTARKLAQVQGVSPESIHLLPWPLNPTFLRMAASPASLPLPPAFPKGQVILTVGRWTSSERYKGTDELIRSIPRLRGSSPDLHLVVVGGGDDLSRLHQIAADLGVADCVHFLESLSREEVAACYAHADIFALPSTGEGFGLVFLEAMVFAKPVVGVNCGGTIDVVEDGINGLLVPPHDAKRLAHALERVLHDKSLRAELGGRGAAIVREKYRFDVFQAELEAILGDSVVRENGG